MPSFAEWLAEYRSRRPAREVVLHRATLPEALTTDVSGCHVTSVRISRYDDPDNPMTGDGFYLFSLDESDNVLTDTWHEMVDDAFAQAEYGFCLTRPDWTPVDGGAH